MARCLLRKRFAPAAGAVGQTELGGKRLKIHFLDISLGADIRPTPFIGQIQARQDPRLDLFPGVFGQKLIGNAEFRFDLFESVTSSFPAIAVNAQYKDVCHRIEPDNF